MNSYHSKNPEEVLNIVGSSIDGLNTVETHNRLEQYGYNELPSEKKIPKLVLFFHQFSNPLIYILLVAALISFFTSHVFDGLVIVIIVLISAIVGYLQESKANDALEHLKNLVEYKTNVLRDGEETVVLQKEIVPGDIIILRSGDKIPADTRLISVSNFSVVEAALTGESVPSIKFLEPVPENTPLADRENMAYLGTVVASGIAKAVVVSTGLNTELGKLASIVKDTKENKTPLQIQLIKFSKVIGSILVGMNILIFALGILTGRPLFEMFMTSVAVVVSAVPEGLLPALTIVLAIGTQKLARKNGLVRKLVAAETLGSVTVICTDKTGTLTMGEMTPTLLVTADGQLELDTEKISEEKIKNNSLYKEMITISLLCNNAFYSKGDKEGNKILEGDHTDKALVKASEKYGFERNTLSKDLPRLYELPFTSENKYMATLHKKEGENILYVKGSPDILSKKISHILTEKGIEVLTDQHTNTISNVQQDLTAKGFRVLALAKKFQSSEVGEISEEDISELIFLGMIALYDPLRPETKSAIEQCKNAGIRPIIITGDHKLTALSISEQLGLTNDLAKVMDGNELDSLSNEELRHVVNDIIIFSRVSPEHKIKIVKALQDNGEVVAMTGDGVNDAPALKKADIGVAVGSGTDVAKEVADLVLLDDNFGTIVEAVKRGRIIFDNIRKLVIYLVSDSFSEMVIVGTAVVLGLPLPVLPIQILWIKLIESSTPSISLAFDEVDENVMSYQPRKKDEQLINSSLKKVIAFYAIVMDITILGMFYYFYKVSGNIDYTRTIIFVSLGLASLFYIYSIRGLKTSIVKINPFSNKLLIFSTVFGLSLFLAAIYVPFFNNMIKTVPLGISEWLILFIFAAFSVLIYEIAKKLFINKDFRL